MAQAQAEPKTVFLTKTVKVPIPFFVNLAANTNQTLASNPISVYFKVVNIEAHFRDDTANNLQISVFSSNNRNLSTTTPPPDDNIISQLSPTAYLVGQGEIISLPCQYEPAPNYQYIKVYFANTNAYAITALCVVTIEAQLKVPSDAENIIPITDEQLQKSGNYQVEALAKTKAVLDAATSVLKGTPALLIGSMSSYAAAATDTANGAYTRFEHLTKMDSFIPPDAAIEDRAKFVKAWLDEVLTLSNEMNNNGFLVNSIAGALGSSAPDFYNWMESNFGVIGAAKQVYQQGIESAVLKSTQYYWNSLYKPNIPSYADLINMVVKEVLTVEQFKKIMVLQGYNEDYSQKIWDAHFIQPDYASVVAAIRRGHIPLDQIDHYLYLVDLDPRYNDTVWKPLIGAIPDLNSAIQMLTREVIDQKQFNEVAGGWGFDSAWGQRFWDAHFTPATFIDFLTAMRRKLTVNVPHANALPTQYTFGEDSARDLDTLHELSKLADYDPRYQSFFDTRIYNDPTPRMSQWAYESNTISETTLRDVVHRYGYTPDTEKWFGDMLIHFRERAWVNRYLTKLLEAYTKDVLSYEEIETTVVMLTNNKHIAQYIQTIGDLQKKLDKKPVLLTTEKLLSVGELKQLRYEHLMDEESFTLELQIRGYKQTDIDLINALIYRQIEEQSQGGAKVGLTIAETFDAYRYGFMSEDELRTGLQLRGMPQNEANILIATKKAKWGIIAPS
jgi:hypothetical protein